MIDRELLAYLAGCMDSDGYFSIRRSTYAMRKRGDSSNPIFSARIGLKQVTQQVPNLLYENFGGRLDSYKPKPANSRLLYQWDGDNTIGARATAILLPFLRIKIIQAEIILELEKTRNSTYWRPSYWFEVENPSWRDLEMVTLKDAEEYLGYKNRCSITQAIENGTILALPYTFNNGAKRIPKDLLPFLKNKQRRPRQLIAWRESLYKKIKELNKIGVNGTPVFHQTGIFKPLA